MDNIKNAIIAILTGLLALSLFTQPAQSATKTYDAVKLVQYAACIDDFQGTNGFGTYVLAQCAQYKP